MRDKPDENAHNNTKNQESTTPESRTSPDEQNDQQAIDINIESKNKVDDLALDVEVFSNQSEITKIDQTDTSNVKMLNTTKERRDKIFMISVVVFACLGLFIGGWKLLEEKMLKNDSTSDGSSWVGVVTQNNFQVFRRIADPSQAQSAIYTISDDGGSKVVEATGSNNLSMITPVGSEKFLFIDTTDNKSDYYLLGMDGLNLLSNLPSSLMLHADSSQDKPVGLSSFGENTVAYQYCMIENSITEGENQYQCDLRRLDLLSGQESVMEFPAELVDHSARLLTFSVDRKSAFFMGISKENAAAFQSEYQKITNGETIPEDDPRTNQITDIKVKRTILQLDLASQKVVENKVIETGYTYYRKFWLSPNGQHLVYSSSGESGELQYINMTDGSVGIIKLPIANQSSAPWSGRSAIYDPLFSENGEYMSYVTFDTNSVDRNESMGVIYFHNKTSKEFAKEESSGIGRGGFFGNMRWMSSNQIELTAALENYSFNVAETSAYKQDDVHGQLVGVADGYR